MQKRYSILSVCWYKIYPPQSGGQNGIAAFNEAVAAQQSLTFICSKNNIIPANTPLTGKPVLGISKWQFLHWRNYRIIQKEIGQLQPALLILEHPYYFLLYLLKKKYAFQLILHAHNIEYQRARENGKWFWPLLKIIERIACKKADFIICKTKEDASFFAEKFAIPIQKMMVIPYCSSVRALPENRPECQQEIFSKYDLLPASKIFLFAGSFDYEPNQQALLHLVKTILPNLKTIYKDPFKILLCGVKLEEFIQRAGLDLPEEFLVLGWVPDIQSIFKAADVFINPVRKGGGIQTKNIDALAQNCSVVGYTTVGNGMPEDLLGKKIFLTDPEEPFGFAKNIVKALENPVNTPPGFYTYYNWKNRVEAFLKQY